MFEKKKLYTIKRVRFYPHSMLTVLATTAQRDIACAYYIDKYFNFVLLKCAIL